jgi:hypothetical protein
MIKLEWRGAAGVDPFSSSVQVKKYYVSFERMNAYVGGCIRSFVRMSLTWRLLNRFQLHATETCTSHRGN